MQRYVVVGFIHHQRSPSQHTQQFQCMFQIFRKKYTCFCATALAVLTLGATLSTSQCQQVDIPDPALRESVIVALGITNDVITSADMEKLHSLDASRNSRGEEAPAITNLT